MKKIVIILVILSGFYSGNSQVISKTNFTIGETLEIESKILNQKRDVNIYFPESYSSDSIHKYPVIYLLDGSRDEDFIHVVGLVQFCSFSWINILPESIVVGIGNSDRKHDFTYPSSDERDIKEFPTTGGSEWWDNGKLLNEEIISDLKNKKVYIAVGQEGKIMKKAARRLYKKLKKRNGNLEELKFHFFKEQNHGDVLHIGTDGAGSVVRKAMMGQTTKLLFNYSQDFLRSGYKELSILPGENNSWKIHKEALHIWPRDEFMIIALPNMDGSFTLTMFHPFEGKEGFNARNEFKS